MAIVGIESLIYSVDDFDTSTQFFEDYGLPLINRDDNHKVARFLLAEGSNVYIRKHNDPWFQNSKMVGNGVRECIWGVDSQESLQRLTDNLAEDHELKQDADGTLRFVTAFGQAIGLKVWSKQPVYSHPSLTNSPGRHQRINETVKWHRRAIPKSIQHVVWGYKDINEALLFYRDRLNFRLVDLQIGSGVYIRADGATDHHNMFIADANNPALGFAGEHAFHHANFGVESIDELMTGKNYMERRGWPKSTWGLGRHRISSGAFLYLHCPAGGEAEYGTDIDVLDDRWQPRVWEQIFGFHIYVHNLPEFVMHEIEWNMGFCSPDTLYPTDDTPGEAAAAPVQALASNS